MGDGCANLGGFGAVGCVIVENVESTADQAREGDEVLLGSLLGGRQDVPFEGQRRGEVRLGERHSDDGLGVGVSQRPGVEMDLQCSCEPMTLD